MRAPLTAALFVVMVGAGAAAQLAPPNTSGVTMGHLHYQVKDIAASVQFWTRLGGRTLVASEDGARILFPGVAVHLSRGASSGGSNGSVVNHVAFRVPAFSGVESAGLKVERFAQFPGVGSVTSPEGERIELFEDAAPNLGFVLDPGSTSADAARHNRPVGVPVAFHHFHLYVPADAVTEAKAWYVRVFGGVPGKRSQYDAVDLPGVNVNISAAPKPAAPTKGRTLDHLAFEVTGLEAFCRRLAPMGVRFEAQYAKDPTGVGRAMLTDPWGTSIELTEGM